MKNVTIASFAVALMGVGAAHAATKGYQTKGQMVLASEEAAPAAPAAPAPAAGEEKKEGEKAAS